MSKYLLWTTTLLISTLSFAQEKGDVVISVGVGKPVFLTIPYWELKYNISSGLGYSAVTGFDIVAQADYLRFSFGGSSSETLGPVGDRDRAATRYILSVLVGMKASDRIPNRDVFPYLMVEVGYSFSSADSVHLQEGKSGSRFLLGGKSESMSSVLYAVGVDFGITNNASVFVELRGTEGIHGDAYPRLIVARMGIGIRL